MLLALLVLASVASFPRCQSLRYQIIPSLLALLLHPLFHPLLNNKFPPTNYPKHTGPKTERHPSNRQNCRNPHTKEYKAGSYNHEDSHPSSSTLKGLETHPNRPLPFSVSQRGFFATEPDSSSLAFGLIETLSHRLWASTEPISMPS